MASSAAGGKSPIVAAALEKLNAVLKTLDDETAPGHFLHFDFLDKAAAKTGLRRAHIALGGVVAALFFIFVGFGASFFSSLIGFLYPMYASMKAINTPDARDDKQWLTYWVVFAVFSLVESVSDRLLFWFPFYYSVKIFFLLYCQLPFFNGATFIYDTFIGPWFAKNQQAIEGSLSQMRITAAGMAERAGLNARVVGPMLDHLPVPANISLDQVFGTDAALASSGSSSSAAIGGGAGAADTKKSS